MLKKDVEKYFELAKPNLLTGKMGLTTTPKAYLLGGQGGVGKGILCGLILDSHINKNSFLSINGDNYREYHPDFMSLIRNDNKFSQETQIFSNIFTEKMIETGIQNRFNLIIEGTMRNPNTPLMTAKMLKDHGYSVEAHVIAAPKEFSSINAFYRYTRELQKQGWGRLVDMHSHDTAVNGLPMSLDIIQQSGLVDRIRIFTMFAKEQGADYMRINGKEWNIKQKPSKMVKLMREKQLADVNCINRQLQNGLISLALLSDSLKPRLSKYILQLQSIKTKVDKINELDISDLTFRNIQNKWLLSATINNQSFYINDINKEDVADYKNKEISDKQLLFRLSVKNQIDLLLNQQSNNKGLKI